MKREAVTGLTILFSMFLFLTTASPVAYGDTTKKDGNKKPSVGQNYLSFPEKYEQLILKITKRHHVDPALVKAVIMAESSMKDCAVTKDGAKGCMQLMPGTAKSFGVRNGTQTERNIEAGTRYLKYLLDEYNGDIRLTLAAYNAGTGTIKRYGGIPPFPGTKSYIEKVLAYYDAYKR